MSTTHCATGGYKGSQGNLSWGGLRPPDSPIFAVLASEGRGSMVIASSATVAASEGQCLGSCPRSAKISMSSQDDLGQGSACSALAMDPKQMDPVVCPDLFRQVYHGLLRTCSEDNQIKIAAAGGAVDREFGLYFGGFGPRDRSQRRGNGREKPGDRFSGPGDHSGPISGHF